MSLDDLAARGGGKYDAEVRELMERLQAQGVVLLILAGNKGSGFSVAATPPAVAVLADVMESAAADMRKHLKPAAH